MEEVKKKRVANMAGQQLLLSTMKWSGTGQITAKELKAASVKFARMIGQSGSSLPMNFGTQRTVVSCMQAFARDSTIKPPGPAAVESTLLADEHNFILFVVARLRQMQQFHYGELFAGVQTHALRCHIPHHTTLVRSGPVRIKQYTMSIFHCKP